MKFIYFLLLVTVALVIFGIWFFEETVRQNQIRDQRIIELSINNLRVKNYSGSDIKIEDNISSNSSYNTYIASYQSEGLTIYGLLTIPNGDIPERGWPAIIFNHGYIPPEQYQTTVRYEAYIDGFAKNGYLVFKPDYRGNGNSQGRPEGAYYSSAYTIDALNALASIRRFPDVNPDKVGMFGHSMGGHLTLESMVASRDIRAGVIWGGVVGSYPEMLITWENNDAWRQYVLTEDAGHPDFQNLMDLLEKIKNKPNLINQIDPSSQVLQISGPLQLHHDLADEAVLPIFSEGLKNILEKEHKSVEYYTYPDSNHNFSGSAFDLAMSRSVDFFNKYLK